MKSFLSSKFVLPFLVLAVTATVSHGQMVRGAGGQPWLDENRCQKAMCPLIKCAPGYASVVPEDKCCPVCKPKPPLLDCSRVRCARPLCKRGYESVIPEGQCCPVCKPKKKFPDCSLVKCALPDCVEGYEPIVPDGKCCPVCKPINTKGPDCSMVQCALPVCTEGYEPVVPEGKCCPVCKPNKKKGPDCSAVRCALPVCATAYEPTIPDGECCPVCTPKSPVLMDTMMMEVMPCPNVECTDACYTYSTDQDAIVPMCAVDEECVTETVYFGGGDDVACPATSCPTFKECM